MKRIDFDAVNENLRKQLDSSRQNWLFGAGISYESKIPLMYPLTERVNKLIEDSGSVSKEIYNEIKNDLDEKSHVEHYLSHLGDLIALSTRSKSKTVTINGKTFAEKDLLSLHGEIISAIGDTVRYGYSNVGGTEVIGSSNEPIVEVEHHVNFVKAIFSNISGILSRSKLTFFTTNYDTLLEDALGLEKFTVIDGFSGGAMGYWNPTQEFQGAHSLPNKCFLYKLHGSIDWQRDDNMGLVRTRYGTKYLSNKSDIMIYPQATKYVETQKDPFSYLFAGFRNALNYSEDNVLVTCGYSFGDEHINAEIEAALSSRSNRTTLVAFALESPEGSVVVNETLDAWLNSTLFGERVYVAGKKGIYYGSTTPIQPFHGRDLNWWTFNGVTNFLNTGEHE